MSWEKCGLKISCYLSEWLKSDNKENVKGLDDARGTLLEGPADGIAKALAGDFYKGRSAQPQTDAGTKNSLQKALSGLKLNR